MVRCRRAVAALTLGPEQTILRAARLCLCNTRRGIGGRQDSTARMPMGVDEKEFVAHPCTLSQKVLSLVREPTLGMKRSVPYRRIGATSDVANLWHREGASPARAGRTRQTSAKAPWASAMWREKCVDVDRVGVNQYPNHRRQSPGWKISPSNTISERHNCVCHWLGVQCMSSVLRTEKDMRRRAALAWIVLNSSCSRWIFSRYEREAAGRAKSST